jgi:hypothetical protein
VKNPNLIVTLLVGVILVSGQRSVFARIEPLSDQAAQRATGAGCGVCEDSGVACGSYTNSNPGLECWHLDDPKATACSAVCKTVYGTPADNWYCVGTQPSGCFQYTLSSGCVSLDSWVCRPQSNPKTSERCKGCAWAVDTLDFLGSVDKCATAEGGDRD